MGLQQIHVALVGLGPIGIEVGRAILARRELKLHAAVDLNPALRGKCLSELLPGASDQVRIETSLDGALDRDIEAIALCTTSQFGSVVADLETALRHRAHLVSTCEEMSAPVVDSITWARLDERAKHANITLLGTGVNPGFVMDRLVLQLAGACVSVDGVTVERVVDAAKRRGPLRKKVGEGLTEAEWRAEAKAGRIGHVGLRESATLVARGLGWVIESYEETLEPVVDGEGRCRGLRQRAVAKVGGKERIRYLLEMYAHPPDPRDRIVLVSDPPMDMTITGGTQGDRGTVATMVNALGRLRSAPRGLVTVADVFT